jgi:hypothetical protein
MIKLARMKAAVVVGAPPSSLTARSLIAAKGPQFTTPNEYTNEDARNVLKWLKGMSHSRQRVSLAHAAGRNAVKRRTP